MGIGEKLKETREAQGLSLDDIQESTKIQKRYLRAIEEGNFHILPGSFYARAFIKEYAQAMGLDDELLLETYEEELPSLGERRSEAQYTRIQRTRKSSGPSRASAFFSFFPTVIVILLVLIIVALAIYFIQQKSFQPQNDNEQNEVNGYYRKDGNDNNENENNESKENNLAEENNEENNVTNNEDEVVEAELVVSEINENISPPETVYSLVHFDEEVILTIQSSGKSWLDVDVENERLFGDFITEDNSPLEFDITNEDEVIFNIGNASYVEIKINDVKLDYEIDEIQWVYQKVIIRINENE